MIWNRKRNWILLEVVCSRWYFAFGLLTTSQRKSPRNFPFKPHVSLYIYIRESQTGSCRWKSIIILAWANIGIFLICISKRAISHPGARYKGTLINSILEETRYRRTVRHPWRKDFFPVFRYLILRDKKTACFRHSNVPRFLRLFSSSGIMRGRPLNHLVILSLAIPITSRYNVLRDL